MVDYNKIANLNFHIQFTKYIHEKDHVLYLIELVCKEDNNLEIKFTERYSTLETNHEKFKKEAKSNNYPTFPPKKFFGNTEPKFLSQRLNSLQSYFSNIVSHKEFSKLKSVKEWIIELFKKHYKPITSPNSKNGDNGGNSNSIPPSNLTKADIEEKEQLKKKNNAQEILSKCSEIVDRISAQFIDLNDELHQNIQDTEDEKNKEKKYSQVINNSNINSSLFCLPKGDNSNFDLLGVDNIDINHFDDLLNEKLSNARNLINVEIKEILNVENIIRPILEA